MTKPSPKQDDKDVGLECPACSCRHFVVNGTVKRNNTIIRYRSCRHCGKRVSTRESLRITKAPKN